MQLRATLEMPPAEQPIDLGQVKEHCRIDHGADDTILQAYIDTAVAHLDGRAGLLGRCMISQGWKITLSAWPCDRVIRLPFPDVSAAAVTYRDADDVEQTLSAALYEILEDDRSAYLQLLTGFNAPDLSTARTTPIAVAFTAGYGDADAVPAPLKAAMLLIVGHLYENREASVVGVGVDAKMLPLGVETLITPYRRVPV